MASDQIKSQRVAGKTITSRTAATQASRSCIRGAYTGRLNKLNLKPSPDKKLYLLGILQMQI